MRLVPIGWVVGQSASAVAGSRTISRILSRTKSAAVPFASAFTTMSLNASVTPPIPPFAQPCSKTRARSSGATSSADRCGSALGCELGIQRPVARGHAEVRRPLEHVDVLRLSGGLRDQLDAGRARADHADALAGKLDAVGRPPRRVVPRAYEVVEPLDGGAVRRRQVAAGHDAVRRRMSGSVLRGDGPDGSL